jgi:hypothetical protein
MWHRELWWAEAPYVSVKSENNVSWRWGEQVPSKHWAFLPYYTAFRTPNVTCSWPACLLLKCVLNTFLLLKCALNTCLLLKCVLNTSLLLKCVLNTFLLLNCCTGFLILLNSTYTYTFWKKTSYLLGCFFLTSLPLSSLLGSSHASCPRAIFTTVWCVLCWFNVSVSLGRNQISLRINSNIRCDVFAVLTTPLPYRVSLTEAK